MKLYYSRWQAELTRRCNQACAHCCRGNAQDLDLTKELVDIFFDKNDIYCIGTLLFSGGEPTLNGEVAEYIIDKIIERNILVHTFMFGINGLSYSEAMARGLDKLSDYILASSKEERILPGLLTVSQSQFHKPANLEVIQKLSKLLYFSPVERTEIPKELILPYGRAFENNLSIQKPNLDDLINYQKNYLIKEYEEVKYLVIKYQYLAANGNVVNDGCQSYDLMDKYTLGNIRTQTIEEMYLSGDNKVLKLG